MIFIGYTTGCRECMKAGQFPFSSNIMDAESEKLINNMTHYELGNQITKWRLKDGQKCWNCDSKNEEILDVTINNESVFSFDDLQRKWNRDKIPFYELNFDKENGKIQVTDGGVHSMSNIYKSNCLFRVIGELARIEGELFIEKQSGNFFCNVSGEGENLKINNLRFHGLSKKELITGINNTMMSLKN
jgi:hypothetical protein